MVEQDERQGVWLDDDGVLHIVGSFSSSSIVVHDDGTQLFSDLDEEEMQRIEQAIVEGMVGKINEMIARAVVGDGVLLAGGPGNAADMLAFWWGDGRRGG